MHPYLHEYYSVQKFKAAYATPIPALTDQSQWPEVDIEFTLCPPLSKRKAGRPKQSRYKAWFEKGVVVRRGKRKNQKSLKGLKKVTKTGASCVRNLGIELVPQNAVTLLYNQSMLMLILQFMYLVSFAYFSI
jgi:hypothetical protein